MSKLVAIHLEEIVTHSIICPFVYDGCHLPPAKVKAMLLALNGWVYGEQTSTNHSIFMTSKPLSLSRPYTNYNKHLTHPLSLIGIYVYGLTDVVRGSNFNADITLDMCMGTRYPRQPESWGYHILQYQC